jgi:hypothetical protein
MGTSIKIEAVRGEKTTKEQWDKMGSYFIRNFANPDVMNDDYLSSGIIYCSYHRAELKEQFSNEILNDLKDSDIALNLWYEERDPDESITL